MFVRRPVFLAVFTFCLALLFSGSLYAGVAEELGDISLPDGVDAADVQRMLGIVSGEQTANEKDLERGDVAPGTLPDVNKPNEVRPNLEPNGTFNIGDAVLIARRAAGDIIFVGINDRPVVTLEGDGDVVGSATWTLNGSVTDDQDVTQVNIEVYIGETLFADNLTVQADGSFTTSLTLSSGDNEIRVRGIDGFLKEGEFATIIVNYDDGKPVVTVTYPGAFEHFNTNPVLVTGTVEDEHDVVNVTINGIDAAVLEKIGGVWSFNGYTNVGTDGPKTITAIATDQVGNESDPAVVNCVYDSTNPEVVITQNFSSPTNETSLTLMGTATDLNGIEEVRVNGVLANYDSNLNTWSIYFDIIAGDNSFTATATDQAGNTGTSLESVIVGDYDAPVLTLQSDEITSDNPYDWVIGINESVTLVSINGSANGTAYSGSSFTIANWAMVEGDNSVTLVVEDLAGNQTTETFTVTLDTTDPVIVITEISREGYTFMEDPLNGVDGGITNAPVVDIFGTVTDANGIDSVKVNGFNAQVSNGTFSIFGIPLIPRTNAVAAVATDLVGNIGTHSITVYQDVEGPAITLTNFERGAYVANQGEYLNAAKRIYDGSQDLVVNGTVSDMYVNITSLTGTFGNTELTINMNKEDSSSFSFTIPYSAMKQSRLNMLNLVATDELGNVNMEYQGALTGDFAARNEVVENGIGAAVSANAMGFISRTVEDVVETLDGTTLVNESFGALGVDVDVYGIAFCHPLHPFNDPSGSMNGTWTPYGCYQDVTVDMWLDGDGYLNIKVYVPYLYVDIYFDGGILGSCDGYASAEATINMRADFQSSGGNISIVPIGSPSVNVSGLDIDLDGCGLVDGILELAEGWIEGYVEDTFEDMIPDLLDSVSDQFTQAKFEFENTGFMAYVADVQNDKKGLYVWMDFYGNPCPNKNSLTNSGDPCMDPVTYPPAQDVYDSPGFLVTPNPDSTGRPSLNMKDNDYIDHSFEAVLNDDLINYLLYAEWAQGTLDMSITQEMVGDVLGLDTASFGNFIPELINPSRTDVQAVVPTGTPITIQMHPILPIVAKGVDKLGEENDAVQIQGGDIILSFIADVDQNGSFETPIFDMAVSMFADATIILHKAEQAYGSDYVSIELGEPTIYTDLAWSAFVMDEGVLRSVIPSIFNLALPMFLDSLNNISVPGSLIRIQEVRVVDPGNEFVSLVGEVQTSIAITEPSAAVVTGDFTIEGTVANIELDSSRQISIVFEAYVNGIPMGNRIVFARDGANNSGEFSGFIDSRELVEGENIIRVVVTDMNNYDGAGHYATSYQTLVVDATYDSANSRWVSTIVSGISAGSSGSPIDQLLGGFGDLTGCMGCQNQDVDASTVLLIALLGICGMILRRRKMIKARHISTMSVFFILFVLTFAFAGCGESDDGHVVVDGDTEKEATDSDVNVDGDPDEELVDGDKDVTDGDLEGETDGDLEEELEIETELEDETDSSENTDGDLEEDSDKIDVDYIDGDYDNDFDAPPNDFTGADVDDNPVVILNLIQLGGKDDGFNLDEGRSPEGDPDPDNGLYTLSSLANGPLQDALDNGDIMLLLKFVGMNRLPAAGESGYVNIEGYFGVDQDEDLSNNFDGNQTFGIDPRSFDENGNLLVKFTNVQIWADDDGKVNIHGGPSLFTLTVPLSEGVELSLSITETQIAGLLEESALREGGIGLNEGLLGGIIPCEILAQPLEALGGLAPLMMVASNVDIDLNRDGELDKRNHLENTDGITAGIVIGGVPAFLDDGSANVGPTIEISPNTPTSTSVNTLTIDGAITDPDGECLNAVVTVKSGDMEAIQAVLEKNETLNYCSFSVSVGLVLGENTIVAKVIDEREAEATDSIKVELFDNEIPSIYITSPANGSDVTEHNVTLSGYAQDNHGILGIEISVKDGQTYAILGTNLGLNGEFTQSVTLPNLGTNTIYAKAKDLSGKVSGEIVHRLTMLDVDPPELVLSEVSDGEITVEPPDALFVHRKSITMTGTISDNAGLDGLMVYYELGNKTRQSCYVLGANFSCSIPELEYGANYITLTSRDMTLNEGEFEYIVTFTDNKEPVITVIAPNAVVNEAEQTLVFTVEDDLDTPENMHPTVSLNGGTASAANYDSVNKNFYLDIVLEQRVDNNSVYIEVEDAASNIGSTTAIIELKDINPPQLTVTAPDDLSEIMEETVVVTGTVTDDLGLAEVPVVIVVGSNSYDVEVIGGEFSQEVALELGENTITTTAYDFSGRTDSDIRTVTRRDPGVPATINLTADPATLLVGTDPSTLTATVRALNGNPVPVGTAVTFSMNPAGSGVLTDSVTMEMESITVTTFDESGVVSVVFNPGATPGVVSITATSGEVFDTTNLILLDPTMALLRICTDGSEVFAGASMSISYSGDAVVNTPFSGSLDAIDLAEGFHTYNGLQDDPMLLWAGTENIFSAGAIGEFSWSLGGGVPELGEFSLSPAVISDLLGVIQNQSSDAFNVCRLDLLLGDLPPVVNLDPFPAVVNTETVTVTATVQDSDLAGCVGTLKLNDQSFTVDVSTGSVSYEVTLSEGDNTITLEVVDANSNLGSDSLTVNYTPYNAQPEIVVTSPGSSTGYESVVVEGTVSDDGPVADLTVDAKVGDGAWVTCSLADNGDGSADFVSTASLPLVIGNNTIQVRAVDGLGATRTINYAVYRTEPVPLPIITITEPAENTIFNSNPVLVKGSVAQGGDPSLITVTLTINGDPHNITWQPTTRSFSSSLTLDEGDYTIVVKAENNSGYDEETRHISYALPDDPPEIAITYPSNGASFAAGAIVMTGTIEDDRPFDTLQSFTVNGEEVVVFDESEFNGTYSASWSVNVPLAEGSNTLTAEAVDRAGNTSGQVSITVTNVAPPAIVLNMVEIGTASEGFNVDQIGQLGDILPDNALSGLGTLANPMIAEQLAIGKMLIILEITGMTQTPGPGETVVVDVIGYIGEDADSNPNNNFNGTGSFNIKPESFDEFGNPIIKFDDVNFRNSFGQLVIDTYEDDKPAVFSISVEASEETPALTIQVNPAYLQATFTEGANGLELDESLLGGVVPAGTLAMDLDVQGLSINPLGLLMRDSATDPVPDVDLNEDGVLATTNPDDVTPDNPDGISVGIKVTGVPCNLNH